MSRKAESVAFVVITAVAFIVIGLAFIVFGGKPSITSKTTYESKTCYVSENNALTPVAIGQCCSAVLKSSGCKATSIQGLNEQMYRCGDILANKAVIDFCSP